MNIHSMATAIKKEAEMKAHREIIDIKNKVVKLNLPDNFKDGKFEVIVLPVETNHDLIELNPPHFQNDVIYSSNKIKNFSTIRLQTKNYKFDRNEANER